ncbi:nuclear transport factor 2 family protein [Arthrobacter sp. ISL-30]|uniref:nuclear transport factor 2 family protein n=1 Tax=Arthrobacter sp. ISL-30 TaxID=2819109 RepID=UPI001BEB6422|nr:nuclear transport factor 2 family protein [Arthrobacter sp. ISL-30]MBT2513842.1 nuclear transport factor 2 family protein [Arthrobacter sp. ISL-30]
MTHLVNDWMNRYIAAWQSNDPADIRALFTEDALYSTRPNDESPWRGQEQIVQRWIAAGDSPEDWTFEWKLLCVDRGGANHDHGEGFTDTAGYGAEAGHDVGGTAFVQGVTTYFNGSPTYDNLWIIKLTGDGRASAFTEWFMAREAPGTE